MRLLTVVHRPAAQHAVEVCDQLPCWIRLRLPDDFPNLLKERMDVLLGRLDQQLAVIPANVLTKGVEALIHMRDDGLLRREFQSTLAQEALDQRLHLIFQQFFRLAGDDEVVCVPD